MGTIVNAKPPRVTEADSLVGVYQRVGDALYGLALAITGEPQAAEDLTQEAFVQVWRRRARLRSPDELDGYLLQAARNLARNYVRRRQETSVVLSDHARLAVPLDEGSEAGVARAEVVSAALAQLPPKQREVVLLRVYDGLPFGELADRLGIPLGTAQSRFRLALQRMRAHLVEDA